MADPSMFTLDNLLIHALPAAAAFGAAWGGVKVSVRDMKKDIGTIKRKVGWSARKVSQMAQYHNLNHAGQHIEIDDYPDNGGG